MSVMQQDVGRMDENVPMEWDPFSDPEEGVPFFGGAGRAETVEQLQHLLRYGPGLVVLAGDQGIGKETLLNHLLDQLDLDLFDVADLQANVMLSFQQLLTSLEEPWRSLHPITLDNYLELVPALASAADEESKTLLCVLRDAELLDAESVADLKALLRAAAGLPLKFLLLVGAVEIEQAPHVRALVADMPDSHVLYLEALTPEQTADYLRFRLQAAGLGKASFGVAQIEKIVQASAGNPARINSVARELLLDAIPSPPIASPKASVPSLGLSPLHLTAAAALLVVVLGFAFLGDDEPESVADVQEAQPSSRIVLENAAQPVQELAPPENRFEEVGRVAEQSGLPEPTVSLDEQGLSTTSASAPAINALENPPGAAVTAPSPTVGSAAVESATPEAAPPPAVVSAPAVDVPAAAAAEPAVAPPPPQPAAVAKAESAKPVTKPASAPAVDSRTRWLQGLPPSHYVIQLLGAAEESTVKRFLGQHPSLKQVTFYKTWRQGKPWYVVVQGDYADYEAAKAGIKRLPGAVQQQTPWVRKVDAVQKEVKG